MKRKTESRLTALLLSLSLLVSLTAPALAAETASVIRLTKTTGTVEISKSSGKSISLLKNMRLYNGYHVATEEESYAWINLDDSKLLKEDAASEVEVRKDGKKLEVLISSGNVFFDVAEPLEDDESLNIRTSTMVVGIRGTSGWIEVVDRWNTRVSVLEGVVECSVADPVTGQIKAEKIRGGETAECRVYPQERTGDKCDILLGKYVVDDIPGFVLTELVRDIPLCDKIEAETGLDIPRDLAAVAGGDPSGREPSGDVATPEVLGEAGRREDEDEDALHRGLETAEKELEQQQDHISGDKIFSQSPAPSPADRDDSGDSGGGGSTGGSGGSSGSGSGGGTPAPEPAAGMKLTDVQVQGMLADKTALSIQPNTDDSDVTPKKNILEVDTGLTVETGKTLTFQPGIDMEVYPGKTLQVDGTLTADNLQNDGTVNVTSGDTLRLRGNLTTGGTLTVPATGRVVVDGTFTRSGTLTLTAGAAVLAKNFAADAAPDGWEISATADAGGYYTLIPSGAVDPPDPVTYPVCFHGNGGLWGVDTEETFVQTNPDGTVNWPAAPVRAGFGFDGWWTTAEGGEQVDASRVYGAETDLYAHWAQGVYTVTFDANGGTLTGGSTVKTDESGNISLPTNPTRTDYQFDGWFTEAAGGTQVSASTVFDGDMTVYAHWTQVIFTITFDSNDGTGTTTTVKTGTNGKLTLPADPTRTDYRFDGWFTEAAGGTQVTGGETYTADTTVYAHWTKVIFTVTFDSNDGTGTTTTVKTGIDGRLTLPTDPTRTGYQFDGWYDAATGGNEVTANTVFTKDMTVYAHWTRITYTITFNANGGTLTGAGTATTDENGNISLPTNPTRTDYRFDGWFTEATGGTQVSASTVFDGDMTVYAHWTQVIFTITFDSNDGTGTTTTVKTGTNGKLTLPADPTRTGYRFDGWYDVATGGNKVTADTVFTKDMTVYAHWVQRVTVTFNANGGVWTPDGRTEWPVEADAGGTVAVSDPTRTDYRFDDWYDAATGGTKADLTNVTADMKVYAHWTLTTLQWEVNGTTLRIYGNASMPNYSTATMPWYSSKDTIQAVVIEDGITNIGSNAFYEFGNLQSVTVPDSVTSIGSYAFYKCAKMTSFDIPTTVTSIGMDAFYGCAGLESIAIPEGVTEVKGYTFRDCTSLRNVTLPSTLTKIESYAFYNTALTSFTIPDSVEEIGMSAFCYCKDLETVVLPKSLTTMSSTVFSACSNLKTVTIPEGVSVLGKVTFLDCTSLANVTIPSTVTSIPDRLFEGCSALSSVTMLGPVTDIGKNAFYKCSALSQITLPNSVRTIGDFAFETSGLTSIVIPEGVTSIGREAFEGCASLTSASLPDTVTTIGTGLFYRCTSLTTANIPGNATAVESSMFANCDLRSITIPDTVTSIGFNAFSGNANLQTVQIPNGVTSIGNSAFQDCTGLTTINIPTGVTSIGDSVFWGCSSLTAIEIPNGVTSIGASAFRGTGLVSVTIPTSVTSIGSSAFENCRALTGILVPGSVTTIGDFIFNNCNKLTDVELGEGVPAITGRMFEGCSSLRNLVIPKSVTTISSDAFTATSLPANIYYRGTVAEWNALPYKPTPVNPITYNYTGSLFP